MNYEQEGMDAFKAGAPIISNPYTASKSRSAFKEWNAGWKEAERAQHGQPNF